MTAPSEAKICIVGGGAAGLTAAIAAGRAGVAATLLERNPKLGIKILMSGGGRCNVTNTGDTEHLVESFPGNGRFLYSAFHQFSNQDILDLLAEEGVETKVEDRGRVFPVRDTAKEVVGALERAARHVGTQIIVNAPVEEIRPDGEAFAIACSDGRRWRASSVIITTGGLSYPTSGTVGDGYRWATRFGHTIVLPRPAIVALETVERWPADVKGVALCGATVFVYGADKRWAQYKEDVLFTHFGLSGPAVLNVSHQAVMALESHPGRVTLGVRIDPARTLPQWEEELDARISAAPKKAARNVFDGWWPASLAPVLLHQAGVNAETPAAQLSRADRRKIAQLLLEIRLTVKRPRPLEQAMVTAGGVDVREVNPKTMESKRRPGLFFAGEVLDVDGVSGGYNLQGAYSTGWVAGRSAASRLRSGCVT